MKIHFDIECTPEEARKFLGLPDVTKMQEDLIKELQSKLTHNIQSMDPENLIKNWLPFTMQGLEKSMGQNIGQNMEHMQKFFWDSVKNAAGGGTEKDPETDK